MDFFFLVQKNCIKYQNSIKGSVPDAKRLGMTNEITVGIKLANVFKWEFFSFNLGCWCKTFNPLGVGGGDGINYIPPNLNRDLHQTLLNFTCITLVG